MNTSCVSAPVVVKVQAMWPLCPMTRNGRPGAVAPASTPPGVSIRAKYQIPGRLKPRCGSPASNGLPDTVLVPSTAHSLLAEPGKVNGSGKFGTISTRRVPASARLGRSRASGGGVSSCGGHSSRRRSAGSLACSAPRTSSDRQLPER